MMPPDPSHVLVGLLVASASAVFSMFVGFIGILRDPSNLGRVPLPRPHGVPDLLRRPGTKLHLVRCVVSVGLSGSLGTLIGGTHPYWAMVASVAALSGPTMRARLTRGTHRFIGTLLGVGLAGIVLSFHPHGFWAVAVIVLMQFAAELVVARNYALAVVFITPLALTMGQLGHEVPVGPLLADRFVETCIGCAVSMVTLVVLRDREPRTAPVES